MQLKLLLFNRLLSAIFLKNKFWGLLSLHAGTSSFQTQQNQNFRKCLDWRFRLSSCTHQAELSELFMCKDFFWNLAVISFYLFKIWNELFSWRPQEKEWILQGAPDSMGMPERATEVTKIRMEKHVGYKVTLHFKCRTVSIDLTSRVLSHFVEWLKWCISPC